MNVSESEVFPACAGMIPWLASFVASGKSVPRMCGDDPHVRIINHAEAQCSPHVRG